MITDNTIEIPEHIMKNILEAIEAKFEESKEEWANDEKDMAEMYESDAYDMLRSLNYAINGDYKAAWKQACNMDTAARDCFPDNYWNYIEEMSENK